MTPDPPAVLSSTSLLRAMRNQIAVVAVGLVLGTVAGFVLASLSQATYMSTTRVLVNPAIGNPYSPTPASVRQDELTSLETEAQMVRSDEVLATVVGDDSTMTSRFPTSTPNPAPRPTLSTPSPRRTWPTVMPDSKMSRTNGSPASRSRPRAQSQTCARPPQPRRSARQLSVRSMLSSPQRCATTW